MNSFNGLGTIVGKQDDRHIPERIEPEVDFHECFEVACMVMLGSLPHEYCEE